MKPIDLLTRAWTVRQAYQRPVPTQPDKIAYYAHDLAVVAWGLELLQANPWLMKFALWATYAKSLQIQQPRPAVSRLVEAVQLRTLPLAPPTLLDSAFAVQSRGSDPLVSGLPFTLLFGYIHAHNLFVHAACGEDMESLRLEIKLGSFFDAEVWAEADLPATLMAGLEDDIPGATAAVTTADRAFRAKFTRIAKWLVRLGILLEAKASPIDREPWNNTMNLYTAAAGGDLTFDFERGYTFTRHER